MAVRSWVYAASRLGPLGRAGRWYYDQVALGCARSLASCPRVTGVYLRGGTLARCRPGISDIDFTVDTELCQDLDEERSLIRALRRRYRFQKGAWQVPGEVVLTRPGLRSLFEKIAPAALLAHTTQKRLTAGEWVDASAPVPGGLSLQSRFRYAFELYLRALNSLPLAHGRQRIAFHDGSFQKYVGKAITASAPDGPFEFRTGSPAESLLAEAFLSLDTLAEKANGQRVPLLDLPVPTAPVATDPLRDTLSGWALDRLRSRLPEAFSLSSTDVPFLFTLDSAHGRETLTEFFAAYLEYLRSPRREAVAPPLWILSPAHYRAHLKGWAGTPAGVPRSLAGDRRWREEFPWHYFRSLLERAATRLYTLRGMLVYAPGSAVRRALDGLVEETARLGARNLASDPGPGRIFARAHLPAFEELRERTALEPVDPTSAAWVRGTREASAQTEAVLREALAWL